MIHIKKLYYQAFQLAPQYFVYLSLKTANKKEETIKENVKHCKNI